MALAAGHVAGMRVTRGPVNLFLGRGTSLCNLMSLHFDDIVSRVCQLIWRHGLRLVGEIALIVFAVDIAFQLLFPLQMADADAEGLSGYYQIPAAVTRDLLQAILTGALALFQVRRIWRAEGQISAADAAPSVSLRMFGPLLVLMLVQSWAIAGTAIATPSPFALALMLIAVLVLAVALTTFVPVLTLEGLGWRTYRRSLRQCLPHMPRLLVLNLLATAVAYLIPVIVIAVQMTSMDAEAAGPFYLITESVALSLHYAMLVVLPYAVWESLTEGEAGGSSRTLAGVFD